jgi:hypothetical protein
MKVFVAGASGAIGTGHDRNGGSRRLEREAEARARLDAALSELARGLRGGLCINPLGGRSHTSPGRWSAIRKWPASALSLKEVRMKPVSVSIDVPQSPERVYEYIGVLANHEGFTDHFLLDWQVSGPASGVGARARMCVKSPGPDDWLDMEVIDAVAPRTTAEESVSAKGRRRNRGNYVLEELPGGGTRISFELTWLEAPLRERLTAPLTRAVVRRANARSLQRLAQTLAAEQLG